MLTLKQLKFCSILTEDMLGRQAIIHLFKMETRGMVHVMEFAWSFGHLKVIIKSDIFLRITHLCSGGDERGDISENGKEEYRAALGRTQPHHHQIGTEMDIKRLR